MNILSIVPVTVEFGYDKIRDDEYLVDEVSLPQLFCFDQNDVRQDISMVSDCFGYREPYLTEKVLELRALKVPENMLGTRLPLYLCVCGDTTCLCLHCEIVRTQTSVQWNDIRLNADLESGLKEIPPVLDFEFAIDAYDSVIEEYLKQNECNS